MSFNTIGINNINLDDDHNFDEEDPETMLNLWLRVMISTTERM